MRVRYGPISSDFDLQSSGERSGHFRFGRAAPQQTRFLDMGDCQAILTADHHGLVEPPVKIGETVKSGQTTPLLRDGYDMTRPAFRWPHLFKGLWACGNSRWIWDCFGQSVDHCADENPKSVRCERAGSGSGDGGVD